MEVKNRWVCPTDRELMLRAKLNSGWSVRSRQYFGRGERIILDPELLLIENVIERSKIINEVEKERIQRLVWRLENMRRNVVGERKRSCSMCGVVFGMFRISPSNCTDCFKAVCEKCRIDIQNAIQEIHVLCKICAETREVWKKSGGWFYGISYLPDLRTCQTEKVPRKVSPKCGRMFNDTWEHNKPDIVRLESFKPPEENHNEHPLYKNWAVSSTPDLVISFDEPPVEDATEMRNMAVSNDELDRNGLSPPEESFIKMSSSCPSLNVNIPQYHGKSVTHRKMYSNPFSRKR